MYKIRIVKTCSPIRNLGKSANKNTFVWCKMTRDLKKTFSVKLTHNIENQLYNNMKPARGSCPS